MAARQLWRQPLCRPTTAFCLSVSRRLAVRRQSTQSNSNEKNNNGQQANLASWTVPVVALGVGAGAAYWVMNPPAKNKLQAIKSAATATTVPDLDALLGDSDEIVHPKPASSEDVTARLNEHAFSFSKTNVPGVRRYDGAQLASNALCEDKLVHGKFSSPFVATKDGKGADSWMAWGVFDGHVGWQMADLLTRHLIPYVRRGLKAAAGPGGPSDEAIDQGIKSGFTKLDDKLVKTAEAMMESDIPLPEKLSRLEASYAGSCSLLTLFDPATRKLRVACTGDSRAVLGRQALDGKWEAVELSSDQTGSNEEEVARLNAQFPGETNMVQGGRVWGIMVSRAFGDGMWKWPMALKQKLRKNYNATTVPSGAKEEGYTTGPYLTAEPVITTTEIAKAQPSFVIIASDGLWDRMTSQQAVDLVGQWIKWQASGTSRPIRDDASKLDKMFLSLQHYIRYEQQAMAVQDSNVAVHLMRNGLGGSREDVIRALLTSRYPNSRDVRDDITVQVVMFE